MAYDLIGDGNRSKNYKLQKSGIRDFKIWFWWFFLLILLKFLFQLYCTIETSVGSNTYFDGLQFRQDFVDNSVMFVFVLLSWWNGKSNLFSFYIYIAFLCCAPLDNKIMNMTELYIATYGCVDVSSPVCIICIMVLIVCVFHVF